MLAFSECFSMFWYVNSWFLSFIGWTWITRNTRNNWTSRPFSKLLMFHLPVGVCWHWNKYLGRNMTNLDLISSSPVLCWIMTWSLHFKCKLPLLVLDTVLVSKLGEAERELCETVPMKIVFVCGVGSKFLYQQHSDGWKPSSWFRQTEHQCIRQVL